MLKNYSAPVNLMATGTCSVEEKLIAVVGELIRPLP